MGATKNGATKRKRKETGEGERSSFARQPTPIGKLEALQILQSALRYCQQAGLEVQCRSEADMAGLVLYLPTVKAETTPAGLEFALTEAG
jgi:hypothetical protein